MIEPGRDYLLFDGDCGICAYSAVKAERIDRKGSFVIAPYQDFPETELATVGISYRQCSKKLQVITRKGRIYAGAFGINYFLWRHFPWSLLPILIYLFPLLLLGELIVYRWVAENRRRISEWLGMDACTLKR